MVVLPAYNASKTLEKTYNEIDFNIVDEVILVDDCSKDDTIEVAKQLGIHHIIKHEKNKGYGGNQKSCYNKALELNADIVIMVHPDYQYTPLLIPSMAYLIANDLYHVVLGSRILGKGALKGGLIKMRPFRSPHHSASVYAITGGGTNALPGEISLAHNGVLYLDEILEFSRPVLEVLRQPMEERSVSISRLKYKIKYPANFMLVASMNPCPCGFYGQPGDKCACTPFQISRYRSRISGPLMDRIDLLCEMNPVPADILTGESASESSRDIRARVENARRIQLERFDGRILTNSQMSTSELRIHCKTGKKETEFLSGAINRLSLSARAFSRILKVARTIADLESSKFISLNHLAEAVVYRGLDRKKING